MGVIPTWYWLLPLANGVFILALAVYVCWRRHWVPGTRILCASLAAIAQICITAALEGHSTTLEGHVFWLHVQIPAYAAIPALWFLMVLSYVGQRISVRWAAALFAVPAATVVMHWTDAWGHLYWSRIWMDRSGAFPIMGRVYGPGIWVFMAFVYGTIGAGAYYLLRTLPAHPLLRRRSLVLFGAMALPFAANTLYFYNLLPVQNMDVTPYMFVVTGVAMLWVIMRYRFQGIVPIAARSVVVSMSDGIVVVDLDGRVADVNPAAEALFGWRTGSMIGRSADAAFRTSPGLLQHLQEQTPSSGDVLVGAPGRQRTCAVSAVDLLRRGLPIGRVISLRDVEAERRASEELRDAQRAAEAAAVAKSQFLANMSHEIRTPMNAIVGATDLLLDRDLNAPERDLVETAQEAAHSLLAILDDILDFSKIDAGRLELESIPFGLRPFIEQVVQIMQPLAARKGLELRESVAPEVPPAVLGDPNRLRQIIVNLMGNAIKFTEAGYVELKLDGRRTESGQTWITFTVADTGIGISEDRIGSLFQEFTQGDATIARRFGGTGLGLAISQRLTQKMGGTIRVDSKLGHGTTLTVSLPVAVARLEDIRTPARAGFSRGEVSPGCHVLLTEDNLINQKIGRQILERLGCQVDVAGDGKDAISMAQTGRYDLILMDLHMPGVDGLQATREIRRLGIATPVIALTASVLDETRKVCAAAGMNGFIGKPINLDEISAVVTQFRPRSDGQASTAGAGA